MINKSINYIKKNIKLIIFILIFCVVTVCYNQNSQTLNYILKRGTILEYSVNKDANFDKNKIKEKLSSLNIKYSLIDENDNSEFEIYDYEQKRLNKTILIAIPVLPNQNKQDLFNNISNYIFENYNDSKLIDVKSLNNNYNEGYLSFFKFLTILFISSLIWFIILYLIYGPKTVNQKIKQGIISYFAEQKDNFKNLIKKTKEKGVGYLLRRILFDSDKEDEEENSIAKEIISTIVFVLVAVVLIRYFVGELRWIPSGSMRPTILEHDRVFVKKIDAKKDEIKRGDILVFYPPSTVLSNSPIAIFARLTGIFCKDIAYIKRVIGLPNDKFEVKLDEKSNEYRVYINDLPLNEPYISSKMEWTPCNEDMYCGPFIIPENSYFMMGDNRNNSQDSRFWGFLEGDRIIGKANFMFWPIKRINLLTDKYIMLNADKNMQKTFIINRYEY